jgi:hypothetical protein
MTRAYALVIGFFGSGSSAEIGDLSAICQHDDFSGVQGRRRAWQNDTHAI